MGLRREIETETDRETDRETETERGKPPLTLANLVCYLKKGGGEGRFLNQWTPHPPPPLPTPPPVRFGPVL